ARLRGAPVRLTPRLAELLALLSLHPEGLSGEQLLLLAYGEDGRMGTLKAALSRLRAVVPVASQPYRLGVPYEVDALLLQDALRRGDVRTALRRYRGPLLPSSEVPFLADLREHLAEALRSAVIQSGDEGLLLALAEFSEDDLELWELVVDRLGDSDPRLPLARSRLERVRRD